MEWEETQHGRAAAGEATVREGRHGVGAVPLCCCKGPTPSWVRIGEINVGEGRENCPDRTRPTSEARRPC